VLESTQSEITGILKSPSASTHFAECVAAFA
jgi:hypothetical protein